MTDLYREEILDHYYHPRNSGKLSPADLVGHEVNTLCGDEVTLYLGFKGGRIADVKFEGSGCAISQASASMLTEYLKGKSRQEIEKLDFEMVKSLLKVDIGPGRIECAMLPVRALKRDPTRIDTTTITL
jgi:nitrogen fixation NifU-like protein